MASKKVTIELTEAQARSFLWAIDSLDLLYGNPNDVDGGVYREFNQAMRNLEQAIQAATRIAYRL